MDLTKLSTEDLRALQAGDLSKVSTHGLRALQTVGARTHDGLPAMRNADGSYSTELSITVTDPRLNRGAPTNIPSLWGGRVLDEDAAVQAALASGRTYHSFRSITEAVAAAKQRSAAGGAEAESAFDPTADMSTTDRVLAGIGSGMTSAMRALGGGRVAEALGLPSTREEAERLDAPLAATTAGKVGQVIGAAAPAALAIPFTPATFAGAAAAGGLSGAALTEGGVGDRALGGALGAAGGVVGQALPYVARSGYGILKGLAEPFRAGGRDRIAGRTLQRFATDENALQQLAAGATVTGARPTLAEAARDPGLARLQRAIATMDPEAALMFATRQSENNAARVATLRAMAGDGDLPAGSGVRALRRIQQGPTRAEAEAARSTAAQRGYGDAFEAGIDPRLAELMQPQIDQLMSRPSVRQAMTRARELAAEEGLNLADDTSVQGLHYMKQALDDAIETATRAGDANRARLTSQTARDLSSVLDEISPLYQQARAEFRNRSVPINRQDVIGRLADRTVSSMRDLSGEQRLQANQFSRALNDEARLAQQATGQRINSLEDLLTPTQMQRVGAVRNELETLANLSQAANGPGSQTAQMLASQNLLRSIAGPLGLPDSFGASVVGQTLARPVQFGMRAAEPRIQEAIARGLLDPEEGLRLLQLARAADAQSAPNALQRLAARSSPAAIGGLSAYANGASQ